MDENGWTVFLVAVKVVFELHTPASCFCLLYQLFLLRYNIFVGGKLRISSVFKLLPPLKDLSKLCLVPQIIFLLKTDWQNLDR